MATQGRTPIPKKQKEIANSLPNPYEPLEKGNPNISPNLNRGKKTSMKGDNVKPFSIGIKDIDESIMYYFKNVIKPFVMQNGQRIEVPIMYGNPERWKNIRKDGVIRDVKGKLQIPLLVVTRSSLVKNEMSNPVKKYQELDFYSTQWNPRNKYDRFAVLNDIQESNKYVSVMYPDYYDLTYQCVIWTEYMAQMNHLIEQISFEGESYWGEKDKYKFKTSIREYKNTIELPERKDRLVRSEFTMTVKAYLLPENTVDKYGKPINMNQTRFTARKLIIKEKFIK